ncbi:MAG: DNA cytosine methyltransferase [Faecalibacillus faecis]
MAITLGSLFDGIGVFPLAASNYGIVPLWASEIEKVPISITKKHFPQMQHLGDITKLDGAKIPPVHIITFGSPCQNLSTIGAREGLAGAKSGLFHHAIRIIQEMRCATDGKYPVIAVWENVRGAFSSNNRLDFRAVLESFADTEIPMPASRRWANAGMVRGGKVDVCWRLLDAQYWGEPTLSQRRKRIFVVADFRGQRATEILFKPHKLHAHIDPSRKSWLSSGERNRISVNQARGKIPVLCPFEERRTRGSAKYQDTQGFVRSFGRPNDPFPTLLAGGPGVFSFWYEGEEKEGFIRYLTPIESERLMGLPDDWTKYGNTGTINSDYARWRALGNAIAVPCAEHIMAGIAEVLKESED